MAQIIQQRKDRLEASKSEKKKREIWVIKSNMKKNSKGEPYQRVKESICKEGNINIYFKSFV